MKKYIYFFIAIFAIACSNKKKEIVDKLFLYRDSLGVANVQLYLVDTARENGVSEHVIVNMRKPIKTRIYHYHWMIDSLELELQKY